MGIRGLLRRVVPGCAALACVVQPVAARAQDITVSAVDRGYRGSHVAVTIRGDELTLDGSRAVPALQRRLRSTAPVRVTAVCSADVAHLTLARPQPGRDLGGDDVVTPDTGVATVRLTIPGLGLRAATDVDGCRATVSEPAGYRVGDVAVGFAQPVRRTLYTQSLRTDDRDRVALAAAEAAVTSALTYYVTHDSDLRGWHATPDGRVPGEAVLRLGTAVSVAAAGLPPATENVVRQVVAPRGSRSRDRLVVVAPSTAIHRRLVVIERDFATGLLRYMIVDHDGRLRYRSARPPFTACSDPISPSRCTDPPAPGSTRTAAQARRSS